MQVTTFKNHIGIFESKVLFLSEQKVAVEIFVLVRVLFVSTILTIALLSKNSPNSLKVKRELIDIYRYLF